MVLPSNGLDFSAQRKFAYAERDQMSRKGPVLIAGITLVVICAGIWGLQAMKRQAKPIAAADASSTQVKHNPFRSAVVELTFRSKSLHDGEEYISSTGRRIEYVDAAGGRRREDYERRVTTMRQLNSTEGLTMIFDGAKLYTVTSKDGNRAGRVTDLHEGYDYTVWEDALIPFVELKLPEPRITEEQFLGKQCKVYTFAKGAEIQKWWVWNGVTLRTESHLETTTTVLDTWEEATRVEEDGDIAPGLFIPPADVTFEPAKPTVAEQLNNHKSAPWVRMKPEMDLFF
jgi:hypothetical protein